MIALLLCCGSPYMYSTACTVGNIRRIRKKKLFCQKNIGNSQIKYYLILDWEFTNRISLGLGICFRLTDRYGTLEFTVDIYVLPTFYKIKEIPNIHLV